MPKQEVIHALLFDGEDEIRERAWTVGLDLARRTDVAVAVPAVRDVDELPQGVVAVNLGAHTVILSPAMPTDALKAAAVSQKLAIAVGRAEHGAEALRRTYRLAQACARACSKAERRGIVRIQDALHLAALDGDPAARSEFVNGILGPILRYTKSDVLLRSLVALQDEGWHAGAAASSLHVSPQTIGYRLNRVYDLARLDRRHPPDRDRLSFAMWLYRLGVR